MGARELLIELADAGLTVTVEGDQLLIRPASKLTQSARVALRANKPELVALLRVATPERPFKLTPAQAAACHRLPWDDATCARFTTRMTRFLGLGLDPASADDLAERLTLRDLEQDDRRMCIECVELADSGRCLAAARGQLRDTGRHFEPERTRLHRCPAFKITSAER